MLPCRTPSYHELAILCLLRLASATNTTTNTTATTTTTITTTAPTTTIAQLWWIGQTTTTVTTTTSTSTSTTTTTSTSSTTNTTTTSTTSTSTTSTSTSTTSTTTTTEPEMRILWASKAGGLGNDWGTFLTFDVDNKLYITGECGLSASKSVPASFGSTKLPCSTGQDMFLMNVNGAGDVLWATDQQRSKRGFFHRRIVDKSGNVYETRRDTGKATVTKHNGEGMLQWIREWSGTDDAGGDSVAVDSSDNVYVLGHFAGRVKVGDYQLSSVGTCAVFVNKLSGAGDVLWSVSVGGDSPGKVGGYGIAVDDVGCVYITGAFEGTLTYGSRTLQSNGEQDIFVLKLDSYGNVMWAIGAGGAGQDSGNSIGIDQYGDVYVTGSFSGRASFGSASLESDGDLDVFWMKMGSGWTQRVPSR